MYLVIFMKRVTAQNCKHWRRLLLLLLLLLRLVSRVWLCDPIDGSPPGSPVPGILQARTLEWVETGTIPSSQCVLHKCEFSLLTLPSYTCLPFWLETLVPRPQVGKKVWWYRILFTSCVALDKSLDLSESQLPCLQNGEKNKGSFQGLRDTQGGKLPGIR